MTPVPSTQHSLSSRRVLVTAGALALSVLSCGREPTAPGGGSGEVTRSQGLAFVAEFPKGIPAYQAAGGAGVAFTKVRVVLRSPPPENAIVFDELVDFPEGADAVPFPITVPLAANAPAGGVPFALSLAYQDATGQTVFSGGPVTVTAVPAIPGAPLPQPSPVFIPVIYTGPGANAVSVRISPPSQSVAMGGSFSFSAQALDASGGVVANTPIVFSTSNGALANVNAATGAGTAGTVRGTATIMAALLTGPSATASVTVTPVPSAIAIVSGSGQTGTVGQNLANPLVVRVTAADGLPVAGASVNFGVVSGGGSISGGGATDASGQASATWTLGATVGSQSASASAGAAGSVSFGATATAAPPVKLLFSGEPPSSIAAGATFGLSVQAVDATNTLSAAFTGAISLSSAGGLTGTTSATAVDGVATFSGLKFATPGTYTIGASASGLAGATSASVVVTAGAVKTLSFSAYPGSAAAGATLDGASVIAKDSLGNTVTTFVGAVTLSASGPAGGGLIGTTTVNAVAGVASFSGLKINVAGSYSLTASAAGLTVTGGAFSISGGAAAVLSLVSGGGQSGAGSAALAQPIVVKVSDSFGNGVAGVTVTFAPAAGSVTPTTAVSGAGGLAQTAWTLGPTAGAQTLNVTGPGLAPNPLVVSATATTTTAAGPAAKLVFTTEPSTVAAASPITPSIVVTAKDAADLVATTFTGTVTLEITANPGASTLGGTTAVAAVAGVATFPGITLNNPGVGYRIRATSGALTPDTSVTFNVGGGAIASTLYATHLDSLYSFGDFVTRVPVSRDATTAVVPGTYTYVSRSPAVATVNSAGLITAIANGTTYIVATETGGTKDSTLVVVQQRVATVNVTPNATSVYKTRTIQFSASAVDGRGNVVAGAPAIVWSTVTPSIASTNATGLVTGVALGSTQVRGTSGTIIGVASINVLTPITRIIVGRDSSGTPVTDTTSMVSLGIGRRFRAEARDTLDAVMTGVTFAFTSTNGSVALLDSITATTARALSNANGLTSIQATADGITGSATLRVAQLLASIELTPTPDTIGVTGTVQLTARGKDANDRYISGGSFTYASGTPAVATVNASTGVVTGVSLGTTNITAQSGPITSNNAVVVVSTTVPAIISFGRDTLTVGRGANVSIPIYLSRPHGSIVTVNLAARDTNAYFSAPSVNFPIGTTAVNVTLSGRNAGTTEVYALDGSGTGFKGDTAAVAVQANMGFSTGSWSLNSTDQVAAQVLLSDPSPAGGTFVTFTYGTAGRATVSPDPAFIPAGQLASNVVITALGSTTGSTTITPTAAGVNGTASTLTVYAPKLQLSAATAMLGAGQNEFNHYVQVSANTNVAIPVTFTSSDTSKVTVTPTATIPGGSYYVYYTITGKAPGTAMVIASAPGWQPDTLYQTVTSPRTTITGATSLNTTSPVQHATIYATDSLGTGHYRTSSLALTVTSSDTNVIRVLDVNPSIAAGQYYVGSVRYQPGGLGGTAYVKVIAGGHRADSILVTVVGPKLEFNWGGTPLLGKGQYDLNQYVYTPNNVTAPLTVTLTSDNPAKGTVPATVTIPTGSYYAYFNPAGVDTGLVRFIATAPGYQADTGFYRITSPRVTISGGGTRNAFSPPAGFTVYSTDSLGGGHYRTAPLVVSFRSTDTTVIKVDSATGTIAANLYYHNTAHTLAVGTGTAYLVAEAPGHRPDSVLYTVQTPKLNFSFGTTLLGRRQHFGATDMYVYTPDNRTTPLAVTFTQSNAAADSLSSTSLTIPIGLYYQYFAAFGRALGTDTIIASAPGYAPDTAIVRITTPKFTQGGLPGSATTTSPPGSVTVYATDSVGNGHFVMDTVVVQVVSSDTTVIRPALRYVRIPRGQYYFTSTVNYVGPGTANLTFSDSAGTGYLPVTTNNVTVTGPSLTFSTGSVMYGMRQRGAATDIYIYTQNNVASPVTVNLVSTDTRVATVPASITIPPGQYYQYFTVTAQDTVGTIQIQASASGFGPPTPMSVQVTKPKFVISTSTSARTTTAPQLITVYATDANGNSHYVTENVTVNLASSATGVFTVDSSTVTIVAGNYYTQAAHWTPVAVGSAQLSARDLRATIYKYDPDATANLSVVTPNLSFSWSSFPLGLGQYVDVNYDGSYYVTTQDNVTSPMPVTLTHVGTARTTTLASVTVPNGLYYAYVRLTGAVRGTDSLVASVASPFHNPDTAYTVVDSGRVDGIVGWPTGSLAVGDSVAVTLRTLDPILGAVRRVAAATTFTLAPNASIQFRQGGALVTSVTVPMDGSQVVFYVKAIAAGSGTATITQANYKTYSPPAITVTP